MRKLMMAMAAALMLAGAGQRAQAQWNGGVCSSTHDLCLSWVNMVADEAPIPNQYIFQLTMNTTESVFLRDFNFISGLSNGGEYEGGWGWPFGWDNYVTGEAVMTASYDAFRNRPTTFFYLLEGSPEVYTLAVPTVAPEPATLALLATGLIGLGGVAVRRRVR